MLAASVAIGIYAPSIGYGLVFDDLSLISSRGPVALGNAWLPYRPLRYASLWLDHAVSGGAPAMYHATNVLLHALAAVLLVRCARRFGSKAMAAAAAGGLFAAHPLAVESVAYVAGRRDLLSLVFGVGALLAWTSPRGRTSVALLLVLAGVAAKESAALFLPVLLAASAFGYGPSVRRSLPVLATTTLAALALPVAYGAIGPLMPAGGAGATLAVAARLTTHYVRSLLAPIDLTVEYPDLVCTDDCARFGDAETLLGLVLLAVLVVAVGAHARGRFGPGRGSLRGDAPRDRDGFVLAWLALTLLPVVFLVGMHEPGADRHAYPLLAAAAVGLATSLDQLSPTLRVGGAVCAVVATIALALLARSQMTTWADPLTFWSTVSRRAPTSVRARHNLAGVLIDAGQVARARRQLRRALSLKPTYAPAELGLALVACGRGRYQAASERIARARSHGADEDAIQRVAEACRDAKAQSLAGRSR